MGTYLDVIKVIKDSQEEIQYPQEEHFECLTLSEEFLYGVIINEEELSKYLNQEEIKSICPNWGEISLESTTSLSSEKREKYLSLLKGVMKTNSNQLLNEFLVAEGIISFGLNDLKREPKKILGIVEKIEESIEFSKYEEDIVKKILNEFIQLKKFLHKRIDSGEYILMEYSD